MVIFHRFFKMIFWNMGFGKWDFGIKWDLVCFFNVELGFWKMGFGWIWDKMGL